MKRVVGVAGFEPENAIGSGTARTADGRKQQAGSIFEK